MLKVRIENDQLSKFLQNSGSKGIYLNPTLEDGSFHPDYSVVWLTKDHNHEAATQLANGNPKALGLAVQTRASKVFGLRTLTTDVDSVAKEVRGAAETANYVYTRYKWTLDPLPDGVNEQAVQELLDASNIKGRPLFSTSPTSWCVAASVETHEQVVSYEGGHAVFAPLKSQPKRNEVQREFVVGGRKGLGKGRKGSSVSSHSDQTSGFTCTFSSGNFPWLAPSTPDFSQQPAGPTAQRISVIEAETHKKFEQFQKEVKATLDKQEAQQLKFQESVASEIKSTFTIQKQEIQQEFHEVESRITQSVTRDMSALIAAFEKKQDESTDKLMSHIDIKLRKREGADLRREDMKH